MINILLFNVENIIILPNSIIHFMEPLMIIIPLRNNYASILVVEQWRLWHATHMNNTNYPALAQLLTLA